MNTDSNASSYVVIVGGSLVGLGTALALAARGFTVTVLERNVAPWAGGTGFIVDRALISHVTTYDASGRDGRNPPLPVLFAGRELARWRSVHEWLRERALATPAIRLCEGVDVRAIGQDADGAWAEAADGRRYCGAVLLGADGYRSIVRRHVTPLAPSARYAGYMAWRGLVEERTMPANTAWPQAEDGLFAVTPPDYRIVAFPVPGADGSTQPGQRAISFGWFETRRNEWLAEVGCLQDGNVTATLPPERIPQDVLQALRRVAPRVWPQPWLNAILCCIEQGTLIGTPIVEYASEWMAHGRLALLGDAAHAVTPATGRGLFYGLLDADALANALAQRRHQPLLGLREYAAARLGHAHQLVQLSRELSTNYLRWAGAPRPD